MPVCKHYFEGYSRSKDFMTTLKNKFLEASCSLRPWTVKAEGVNFYKGNYPYLVISHTDSTGEVGNFVFWDDWKLPTNNLWGRLYCSYLPEDTFISSLPLRSPRTNLGDYLTFYLIYHRGQYEDLDYLPQYVWYWMWIDDDSFFIRVMGNRGGEGSNYPASEWVFYGPAEKRTDPDYIFSEPEFCFLGESYNFVKTGWAAETVNPQLNPSFWYQPYATTPSLTDPSISNFYTESLVPIMTSANTPSGVVTSSPYYQQPSFYAFSPGSYGQLAYPPYGGVATPWIQYEFPTETLVTEYSLRQYNGYYPTAWTLRGSNDGTSWTLLDSPSFQFPGGEAIKRFQIPNQIAYKFYRFDFTASNVSGYYLRVNISLGDPTVPTLRYHASKMLLKTENTAYLNQRVYTLYHPYLGGDRVLYFPSVGEAQTADIVALDEYHADYIVHNTYDPYVSPPLANYGDYTGSGGTGVTGGTYFYLLSKRMECPWGLTASASGSGLISLSWTNPQKLFGIKIVRSETNHYVTRIDQGTVVYTNTSSVPGAVESWVDSGRTPGVRYSYSVFSYDSNGVHCVPLISGHADVVAV